MDKLYNNTHLQWMAVTIVYPKCQKKRRGGGCSQ